jgi:hypothetical protein
LVLKSGKIIRISFWDTKFICSLTSHESDTNSMWKLSEQKMVIVKNDVMKKNYSAKIGHKSWNFE